MVNITDIAASFGLPATLSDYRCHEFMSISHNTTDTACREACIRDCRGGPPGGKARFSLQECIEQVPASCRITAELYHLMTPGAICATDQVVRVKYPQTSIGSHPRFTDSYGNFNRVQDRAILKLAIPGQKSCPGTYEMCLPQFTDVDLTSCEIESNISECYAVTATRITDSYIAFENFGLAPSDNANATGSSIGLTHPHFMREPVDFHLRALNKNCPFTWTAAQEQRLPILSTVMAHELVTVAGAAGDRFDGA